MSRNNFYLKRPTGYDAELRSVFRPIFARIAEGNVGRERNRVLPREQVRWLNEAGFGTLRIPAEQGGFGASLEQTFQLLAELAQADANVAHIWRDHLAFVEDRLNAPVTEENNTWIKRFLAGEFVCGWADANDGTLADVATTITAEDGHWLVSGAKYCATGSLYADWLDVIGRGDDGELWTALVRSDDPGVKLVDDWRGFGQRTTASGSAHYDNAKAERGNVFPAIERFSYQPHFYQIAMLAVLTGITKAVQRDGSVALKQRKRNFPQGLSEVPSDDAQLLQVIGEVSAEAFGAESALARSARTLDRVVAGRLAGSDDRARQLLIDAQVSVTQAQLVIVNAALRSTTKVFDALGASAVSEDLGLDRHWRNARTLASHHPVVHNARILGDWFINGNDPVPDLATQGRAQGN